MQKKKTIIISLGGSLIVPDSIDWRFIKKFKDLVEKQIKRGYKFVIITGGGRTARNYIEAAAKVDQVTVEDKDWIGIHATRMNAHFIRTIFRKHAHPRINKNPNDVKSFSEFKEPILVAAGWRPGFSTDYDATILAKRLGIKKIINLSNIDYVCDKDPKKFPDCKKIKNISWTDFRKMIGTRWNPGMNAPFDPIASKLAAKEKMEVAIINGKRLGQLENYLQEKDFAGTKITD